MAFTMHSHSGQFCPGHAKDALEEIVLQAISLKMQTIGLSEHMPRNNDRDLYPEELEIGLSPLQPRHEAYIEEAVRLREKYRDQIYILIGFEAEWIRPAYAELISQLRGNQHVDYFVGSLHHMHEIPTDYDVGLYRKARDLSGGTDEQLFADYFDAHFEMLQALKPPVVGHFDVIRLMSDEPNRDLRTMTKVWPKVERNLQFIKDHGLLLEINSSALRKGLNEPYPGRSIVEHYLKISGKLTLSDDSHGKDQVGLNFQRVVSYLTSIDPTIVLYHLTREKGTWGLGSLFPRCHC